MKYKITKIYLVDTDSKQKAWELIAEKPAEYLEYQSIREVTDEKPSFGSAFKKQVTGK